MQYRYKAFLGLVWPLRCLPILLPMIVYACEIFQEVLYFRIEMLCERVMLHEDTSSWWRALVGRACQEATSRALQLCSPNHPAWATEHAGVATAGGEVVVR